MSQTIEPILERMIREGKIFRCRHGIANHKWCAWCEKNVIIAEPYEKRRKKREWNKQTVRKKGFAGRTI